MILQALYDYAQRKGDVLPEDGFEKKELKFLLEIKEDGSFVRLKDTRETVEGKLVGKSYTLPAHKERTGQKSYETTFLLWDHYGYVLKEAKKESDVKKNEKAIIDAEKQNKTFISMIKTLPESLLSDKGVAAVLLFYEKYASEDYKTIKESDKWKECSKISRCNLSFILEGDDLPVPCRSAVKEYQRSLTCCTPDDSSDKSEMKGICLITGEKAVITRLHQGIPMIGAEVPPKLVSFQKNRGYDSYGKEQSYNAPVSVMAELSYTKALNYLINSKDNHFILGGNPKDNEKKKDCNTIVFWAEKPEAEQFEGMFSYFFTPNFDDPDRNVREVKNLFAALKTGKFRKLDSKFYVLCLSPNKSRISVRFWETGKIETFAKHIEQHFKDFEIIKQRANDREYLPLLQILSATTRSSEEKPNGNIEDVSPSLIGSITRSVLTGSPYPVTLQQQCIRRIRAERDYKDEKNIWHYKITRTRAAILKACLNRFNRMKNIKEVSVALDRNCKNKGYLLGRLFAVFERVQQESADTELNSTITDRFYGAASTNPVVVFTQLIRLNRNHMSKLKSKNAGFAVVREKEIGEIMNAIDSFPAHLDLNEQSYFAIGYYHEKQSFFESNKSDKTEGEN